MKAAVYFMTPYVKIVSTLTSLYTKVIVATVYCFLYLQQAHQLQQHIHKLLCREFIKFLFCVSTISYWFDIMCW